MSVRCCRWYESKVKDLFGGNDNLYLLDLLGPIATSFIQPSLAMPIVAIVVRVAESGI